MKTKLIALLCTIIGYMPFSATAQFFVSASIMGNQLEVCPTCLPSSGLESLNSDMYEMETLPSSTFFQQKLQALVWTGGQGMVGFTPVTDQSYFYLYESAATSNLYTPIPATGSLMWALGNPAHDADIAVGKFYSTVQNRERYFAAVVYEAAGDIYMESFEFDINTSGIVTPIYQHQLFTAMTVWPFNGGGHWFFK